MRTGRPPQNSESAASNFWFCGPVVIQPERSTSATPWIVSSSISGLTNGRKGERNVDWVMNACARSMKPGALNGAVDSTLRAIRVRKAEKGGNRGAYRDEPYILLGRAWMPGLRCLYARRSAAALRTLRRSARTGAWLRASTTTPTRITPMPTSLLHRQHLAEQIPRGERVDDVAERQHRIGDRHVHARQPDDPHDDADHIARETADDRRLRRKSERRSAGCSHG